MENQNIDKQPSQVKRNPTRFNTNVNPEKLDNDKADFAHGRNDTTIDDEDASFSSGAADDGEISFKAQLKNQADGRQNGQFSERVKNNPSQAGNGTSYGSQPRQTESETSHKGQAGGQHASSLGEVEHKRTIEKGNRQGSPFNQQ